MDKNLILTLKTDAETIFHNLVGKIQDIVECKKSSPEFNFIWNSEEKYYAAVKKIAGENKVIVTFNEGLALGIYSAIEAHQNTLLSALQLPNDVALKNKDILLTEIYDIAIHFVLLHEIFHVMGGHTDYIAAKQSNNTHSDCCLGFAETDSSSNYYLELEADANSIPVLVQNVYLESLTTLNVESIKTSETGNAAHWLPDGPEREYGFRILLTSVWIVIVLLEANLPRAYSHPMPAARLLSIVSTFMSWFCDMTNLQIDSNGKMLHAVVDTDHDQIDRFLFHVARPVIVGLWLFPDPQTSQRLGLEGSEESAEHWLENLRGLLLQTSVGAAGRQLESVEKERFEFAIKLKSYRYFSASLAPNK